MLLEAKSHTKQELRAQYIPDYFASGAVKMASTQVAVNPSLSLASCTALSTPNIAGLTFHNVEANVVARVSSSIPQGFYVGHGPTEVTNLSFCNVSLAYSYNGHDNDDLINVQVWLPAMEQWNERLMGVGGGGFWAGLFSLSFEIMKAGVNDGYVAVSTDAGHSSEDPDPAYWALNEEGEVNMYKLENFAYRAYDSMATIAKEVAKTFYGKEPEFSYWNGCSTGGRQGLAMAQRYPDTYNAILAFAPAANWASLTPAIYYGSFVLDSIKPNPAPCEFHALTAAAIAECDVLDGIEDGVIAEPDACQFDAQSLVGREIDCGGKKTTISQAAASFAQAVWKGPISEAGETLWYGFSRDIDLIGPMHIVQETQCTDDKPCPLTGFTITTQNMQWFLAKDGKVDLTKMTSREFEARFNQSLNEYEAIMSTNDPDLSAFKSAGGKMITVHGTADQLIPVKSTQDYYEKVLATDSNARDYYRYFEAPGVAHCFGGKGAFPNTAFQDLVRWAEEGQAPETLLATAVSELQGLSYQRPLCQYPLVARYDGVGDINHPDSFHCSESEFNKFDSTVSKKTSALIEELARPTSSSSKSHIHEEL